MKCYTTLFALCAGIAVRALEVGQTAPFFTAKDQDGQVWKLEEQLGGKPVLVYFYPAAMTGGCTKQACAYRDYVAAGDSAFNVVGISADSPEGLKIFQTSEKLNFPLLSDPGGAVAEEFGVEVKKGVKTIKRMVAGNEVELTRSATTMRWTFVIGPDGKIIYKSDKVKPTEDLRHVLAALKK
ncbi:peroxiredoxin [Pontiella agarivorans]|uniref:thioredoxin-dependent peroxiredoxin n=1 Tax=Pontiella agarivorans TaxID=3038953 RepID=A0ABU5MV75_9BACT|nr:peroxiredoxin [Pontiella agarivorans]MDZ8118118.1 peroxiredoxin [Pontiella agarivorans]